MDAGKLDRLVRVLSFDGNPIAGYQWSEARKAWCSADESSKNNRRSRFAVAGQMADSVTLVMRRQALDRGNAILLDGRHCLITKVYPYLTHYIKVECALVKIVLCHLVDEDGLTLYSFPAAITEKYIRWQQGDENAPQSVNDFLYVLVVPKAVMIAPGSLVKVADERIGDVYEIRTAHVLDDFQNEYEIGAPREL